MKMKMVEISQSQLDSYIRAEEFCRETRYQWTDNRNIDNKYLSDMFFKWFRGCKKIKFDRPRRIK